MKIIEVIVDGSYIDSIKNIAEQNEAPDFWLVSGEDKNRKVVRILVKPEQRQAILDALHGMLAVSPSARAVVVIIWVITLAILLFVVYFHPNLIK